MHDWYAGTTLESHRGVSTPVRDDGEGAAILCLHGFPTTSWDFEPLWADLTAGHRAIAFDLIGLGRASKPKRALPIGLQASVAEDVLIARGIQEAHIFAHDLGDTVAQELLGRQAAGSSRVRWKSVVFLNGGLFPETHQARPIQKLLLSPLGPLIAGLSSKRTFDKNLTRVFGPDTPPTREFLDASWELLESNGGRQMLPRLIRYMAERRTYRERWVQPLIDRIVPIRFINGNLDPVSGRHAADRYAELVPDPDIVHLPRLGHYPHVEDARAVIEPAMAFFEAHAGR